MGLSLSRSRWKPRPLAFGALAHPWIRVVLSVTAVLVMTLSSLPPATRNRGEAQLKIDSGSSGVTPSFYPYLVNTSLFPLPDALVGPAISPCGGVLLSS